MRNKIIGYIPESWIFPRIIPSLRIYAIQPRYEARTGVLRYTITSAASYDKLPYWVIYDKNRLERIVSGEESVSDFVEVAIVRRWLDYPTHNEAEPYSHFIGPIKLKRIANLVLTDLVTGRAIRSPLEYANIKDDIVSDGAAI
jgi:hypothetical protein